MIRRKALSEHHASDTSERQLQLPCSVIDMQSAYFRMHDECSWAFVRLRTPRLRLSPPLSYSGALAVTLKHANAAPRSSRSGPPELRRSQVASRDRAHGDVVKA
eukprot:953403-Pleurochrysis_carterae.AAC.5